MNERIQELAAEILRMRGEPARDDDHFAFAFVRHLFLAQMERAEKAEAALAEAKAQLPAEMQECNIVFKQCKLGHGWLTATNWVQHECQICELAEAVGKERERCAKVCEEMANSRRSALSTLCADAIRNGVH